MRRRLLLLGGVALLAWAVLAAVWMARVASDLRAGRDAASAARDQLSAEQIADREPLAELRVAERRFAAAEDRAGGILLAPLRFAPVIGRQLRSVEALSDAAATVAAAGVDAVERAGAVFDNPAAAGRARVAEVREIAAVVDDVVERLAGVDDLGPRVGLVGPLAEARNELAADLADARRSLADAQAGARAALSLVEGPSRYLVIAANNAEMRAGSGMWLQGGLLEVRDGRLELDDMSPLYLDADPPDGAVVPTGDLAARWGYLEPGDEWRNLMLSPRFPASAELAIEMWAAAGRGEVDGVLVVDAAGLAAIVEATGPVTIDGEVFGADEVVEHVLHDQYVDFADPSDPTGIDNDERRDALSTLARSAVDAIDRGSFPASRLLRTLGDAIAGRHLLAWSTDPIEQAGWEAAGMDGQLGRDSLFVSILNRSTSKLDWFLATRADLAVEPSGRGFDVTVELTVENRAPASGEPRYIVGPHEGLGLDEAEYRGVVTFNVPDVATDLRIEGVAGLAAIGSDGPSQVIGHEVEIRRGEAVRVVVRFRLPPESDHLLVETSARIPGITWYYGESRWEDNQSRRANF